jgi:hypothetical protein
MPWRHTWSLESECILPCEPLLYQVPSRAAWEIKKLMRPGIPLTTYLSPMSVHLHENTSKSRADPRMGVLPPARISVSVLIADLQDSR